VSATVMWNALDDELPWVSLVVQFTVFSPSANVDPDGGAQSTGRSPSTESLAAVENSTAYAGMTNYQRVLEIGDAQTPADAAIVGNEASVTAQLKGLLDAGATDVWAAVFPVGDDRPRSVRRTRELLQHLVG